MKIQAFFPVASYEGGKRFRPDCVLGKWEYWAKFEGIGPSVFVGNEINVLLFAMIRKELEDSPGDLPAAISLTHKETGQMVAQRTANVTLSENEGVILAEPFRAKIEKLGTYVLRLNILEESSEWEIEITPKQS